MFEIVTFGGGCGFLGGCGFFGGCGSLGGCRLSCGLRFNASFYDIMCDCVRSLLVFLVFFLQTQMHSLNISLRTKEQNECAPSTFHILAPYS